MSLVYLPLIKFIYFNRNSSSVIYQWSLEEKPATLRQVFNRHVEVSVATVPVRDACERVCRQNILVVVKHAQLEYGANENVYTFVTFIPNVRYRIQLQDGWRLNMKISESIIIVLWNMQKRPTFYRFIVSLCKLHNFIFCIQ